MRKLIYALLTDLSWKRATRRKNRDERGFTLTELMVVIFILGLLATVVFVNVIPALTTANETKARSDITALESAMERYKLDMLTFPSAADGIQALKTAPAGLAEPGRYPPGGYVRRIPDDPWNRPYQLAVPGRNGEPFEIYSLGADGAPGGEGENADIYGGEG